MDANLIGATLDDRYRITRLVRTSATRELYEAEQTKLGRTMCIEIFRAPMTPEATARFLEEAKGLARLDHPNIVYVLDSGTYQGRPYLVREAAAGETLEFTLATGAVFTPERAIPIVSKIAEGLAHAHAAKVVHRNLSPSAIILGANDSARIADFELAPAPDASSYMSPEQLRGQPADVRSDLYALGMIAKRMMSHPGGIAAVIERLTAQDPAQRFQSAGEVIAALGPHVKTFADPPTEKVLVAAPKLEVLPPPLPPPTPAPAKAFVQEEPSLSQDLPAFFRKESSANLEPISAASLPAIDVENTFSKGLMSALPTFLILLLAIAFGGAFWVYVLGLPDTARDARAAVRTGRGASVIMQIEALIAKGRKDPDLHAALGYALVQADSPKKAIPHFAAAAEQDPSSLQPADVAALVSLLGMPGEESLAVERTLKLVTKNALPWLRIAFSTVTNDAYLRCRAGAVLRAAGEQGVDEVPACLEAIAPRHCGIRGIVIPMLKADQRAAKTLKAISEKRDHLGAPEC